MKLIQGEGLLIFNFGILLKDRFSFLINLTYCR